MSTLYTIGYEKSDIGSFLATLKHASIDVLVDVRDLPLSRKKGFSKNALRANLEEKGIRYLHIKALGDPKPGRTAARAGDYETFEEIFRNHMESDEAQEALEELSSTPTNLRICLLCFERHADRCHRSIVADDLANRMNLKVAHIEVE